MSIHPSWKWHAEEPPLFLHGARRTSLQRMEGDPHVQNALGAAHSEIQHRLHMVLQGGPRGTASSTSSHWGDRALIFADPQSVASSRENQCKPLRRTKGQHLTLVGTSSKATHHLHVTGKVHLTLPTILFQKSPENKCHGLTKPSCWLSPSLAQKLASCIRGFKSDV